MPTLAEIIAYLHTEEIEEEESPHSSGEVIVQDDGTIIYPAEPEAADGAAAEDEPAERRLLVQLVDEVRLEGAADEIFLSGIGADDVALPGLVACTTRPGMVTDFQGSLLIADPDAADEEQPPAGAALLVADRPRLVFALIVERFFPELLDDAPPRFHNDRQREQAQLAHACVMNAFLGPNVSFGPHATIGCTDTQYEQAPDGRFVRLPQRGTVILEGDTEIGAQATVHRPAAGVTRLCRGAKIGPWSEIGAGATLGRNALVGADVRVGAGARIGAGAVLETTSAVTDGATIGDGARILAGAAVEDDVPGGETWAGAPAMRLETEAGAED